MSIRLNELRVIERYDKFHTLSNEQNRKITRTASLLGINQSVLSEIELLSPDSFLFMKKLSNLIDFYLLTDTTDINVIKGLPTQLFSFIIQSREIISNSTRYYILPPYLDSNRRSNRNTRYCKFALAVITNPKDDVCTICLERLKIKKISQYIDDIVEMPCGHQYHYDCINRYVNANDCCHICQIKHPY